MTATEVAILEQNFIDRHSLSTTLLVMAEICFGKADHLLSNWQDETMSDQWANVGRLLENAERKIRPLADPLQGFGE